MQALNPLRIAVQCRIQAGVSTQVLARSSRLVETDLLAVAGMRKLSSPRRCNREVPSCSCGLLQSLRPDLFRNRIVIVSHRLNRRMEITTAIIHH